MNEAQSASNVSGPRLALLLLVMGVAVEAVLGARFALQAFGRTNGIVLEVSDALVDPFRGYEPAQAIKQTGVIEVATLFAIEFYLVVTLAAVLLAFPFAWLCRQVPILGACVCGVGGAVAFLILLPPRTVVAACSPFWRAGMAACSLFWRAGMAACSLFWRAGMAACSLFWRAGMAACSLFWRAGMAASSLFWRAGTAASSLFWRAGMAASAPAGRALASAYLLVAAVAGVAWERMSVLAAEYGARAWQQLKTGSRALAFFVWRTLALVEVWLEREWARFRVYDHGLEASRSVALMTMRQARAAEVRWRLAQSASNVSGPRLALLLLVMGVAVEAVLGARFALQAFGRTNGIVLEVSDALVDPFRGYEPAQAIKQTGVIEVATLFAIEFYLVVTLAAVLLAFPFAWLCRQVPILGACVCGVGGAVAFLILLPPRTVVAACSLFWRVGATASAYTARALASAYRLVTELAYLAWVRMSALAAGYGARAWQQLKTGSRALAFYARRALPLAEMWLEREWARLRVYDHGLEASRSVALMTMRQARAAEVRLETYVIRLRDARRMHD